VQVAFQYQHATNPPFNTIAVTTSFLLPLDKTLAWVPEYGTESMARPRTPRASATFSFKHQCTMQPQAGLLHAAKCCGCRLQLVRLRHQPHHAGRQWQREELQPESLIVTGDPEAEAAEE